MSPEWKLLFDIPPCLVLSFVSMPRTIKKHQATLGPSAVKHSSSLKGCNPAAKVAHPDSLLPLSPVPGCEDRKLQKYLAT
ncbi:unnamed protein product [Penicillium camemberti]|uniref:Str. FM013 n=1 Tax=Penicillium camemberti (strain FM 013) TaxID=1429867 RepID=A0A0G4PFQ8_PENC3|nr:unnamed protein product [Penicillium camemberti]